MAEDIGTLGAKPKTNAPAKKADKKVTPKAPEVAPPRPKKPRVVRNFPASPFEEALTFAKSVLDFGAGATVR